MGDYFEENRLFASCREEVAQKFFGKKDLQFKHSDFVSLSEEIFEETKVSIGLSTLKRIWANDYSGLPNISTLDALVKYIGYQSWNVYRRNFNTGKTESKFLKPFIGRKGEKYIAYYIVISICVISVLATLFIIRSGRSGYRDIVFSYTVDKENAIPVTVAFHYDLRGIKFKKAQIIPQDHSNVFDINAADTILTYTYRWPGIFHSKLLIEGKVVKELTIDLKTNGWKAAIEKTQNNESFIHYLNNSDIYADGNLSITSERLVSEGFGKDDFSSLYYTNHTLYPQIKGDAFRFETRIMSLRTDKNQYSGLLRILLTFGESEENCIHMPVTILNEQPKSGIRIFNNVFEEENNILSFLHIEPAQWNTIMILSADRKVSLFINEKEVFSSDYQVTPGSFQGIDYICHGMTKIDYLRFYDENNKLVYDDEFDRKLSD